MPRTLLPILALLLTLPLAACTRDTTSTTAKEIAPGPSVTLQVEEMVCNGCVNDVKEAIEATPGVLSADVSLDKKQAVIRLDPKSPANIDDLCKKLTDSGHAAKVVTKSPA